MTLFLTTFSALAAALSVAALASARAERVRARQWATLALRATRLARHHARRSEAAAERDAAVILPFPATPRLCEPDGTGVEIEAFN